MRERIFSNVLLPAPFLPMMPTVSPSLIVKETSFNAQINDLYDEEPQLRQKGNPIDDLTILDVQSRKPKSDSQASHQHQQREKGQPHDERTNSHVVEENDPDQQHAADQKIEYDHQATGKWNNDARKVHTADQALVGDQAVTRF